MKLTDRLIDTAPPKCAHFLRGCVTVVYTHTIHTAVTAGVELEDCASEV